MPEATDPEARSYDVVVVGFGVGGAAAAIEAARAGGRVLVLERRGVRVRRGVAAAGPIETAVAPGHPARVRGRLGSRPRAEASPLAALRAEALIAGVELRQQTAVHEIVVEGGRVAGVGYAALDPLTAPGARYRWLDQLSDWTPRLSASLSRTLRRAAEALWHEASEVGRISAAAVILGTERQTWDYVGPAVWGVQEACGPGPGAARRRRLSLLPDGAPAPSPELAARSWCARQAGLAYGAAELHVDRSTGQLSVGGTSAVPVPGLYAAGVERDGLNDRSGDGAELVAAGRRAGRAATIDRPSRPRRPGLRSVG